MSGNHFLRSMAEPHAHEPEGNNEPTPEVHFAETVSVVTGINNLAEVPLVDVPLELTTVDDTEGAKANEQIRRSASKDRDMKDEESLALKTEIRATSEEPVAAAQTAEVAQGVENLEITTGASLVKKRKKADKETVTAPKTLDGNEDATTNINEGKMTVRTRRGTTGGKRRGGRKANDIEVAENQSVQELRRSKRRKSE